MAHRIFLTPRQAEDLFLVNLRALHPDAALSAAIDRYDRRRPAPDAVPARSSDIDEHRIAALLAIRRNRIAKARLERRRHSPVSE